MGVMPLRYPLRSLKSREQNWAGSLRYPLCFVEVEGAEPGGAFAAVVMSGGVCRGLSFGVMRYRQAAAVVFGMEVVFRKCNS